MKMFYYKAAQIEQFTNRYTDYFKASLYCYKSKNIQLDLLFGNVL